MIRPAFVALMVVAVVVVTIVVVADASPEMLPGVPVKSDSTQEILPLPSPEVGRQVGGENEVMRKPVPAAPEALPLAALNSGVSASLDYFNRMLVRGGKDPVPANALISADDVPAFQDAVDEMRRSTDEVSMRWRVAVNQRSTKEAKRIEEDLNAGIRPRYDIIPRGAGLPKVDGPYDMVAVHTPAGTVDRYVIRLPALDFQREVADVKQSVAAQLALFDGALRTLFVIP